MRIKRKLFYFFKYKHDFYEGLFEDHTLRREINGTFKWKYMYEGIYLSLIVVITIVI